MENEKFFIDKFITKADYLLFDVPRENRTYAVCLEAVKHDWQNLSLVPYDLRTSEICMEALKHEGKKYGMLPYIPREIQDPQVWLLAVKNGLDIKTVPPELLTEEMCVCTTVCAAEYIGPQSMCDIPEHFRTRAFWLAAIKANDFFFEDTLYYCLTVNFYVKSSNKALP